MSGAGTEKAGARARTAPLSSGNAPASKQRLRLWLRLLKLSRAVEAELRERLRLEHGSTLPRFDVLAALWRADSGLKMSELSGVLRVSNGNVTGIVDRLVSEGLVERHPVPGDRRAMLVRLTGQGRIQFEAQAIDHEAWVDGLLQGFDPEELDDLGARLDTAFRRITEKEPRT
ncbi:MAG: MarR family transcriptional regulator [Rhodobacteraceae bacterium]|nr:MarR family transcriptional regulator [Paracoccaceae bacterium]